MNGQPTNRWKIFGIIVIVLALVLAAFLIGRGCERKKDENSKTTPTATRQATPPASGSQDTGGAVPADSSGASDNISTVEDDGGADEVTVVSTHDEVGPCIGGFQDVTHTTTYSDGTSASSISRQACGVAPVPVPEP